MAPRFRFHAKKVFLTYADTEDLSPDDILVHMRGLGDVRCYAIGREKYPSRDGYHIHAAVEFAEKIDTTSQRFFDVDGKHPNIQKIKKWQQALNYCCKDGDYIENFMLDSPTNLKKRWENWCLWHSLREEQRQKDVVFPIKMPVVNGNVQVQPEPHPGNKKVNWLIVGPSDWGKTSWFEKTFEDQKVFKVGDSRYPFEGYEGQKVIAWDDAFPKRKDLIAATGCFLTKTAVGETRYRKYYWKKAQRNVCIIMHNEMPTYASDPWFVNRFNVIDLH